LDEFPTEHLLRLVHGRDLLRFVATHGGRQRLEDEPDGAWREIVDRAVALKQGRLRRYTWKQVIWNQKLPVSERQLREWRRRRRDELKRPRQE
jgi:hypothetical protein